MPKGTFHPMNLQDIETHERYVFARANQSKHHNFGNFDPIDTPSAVPTALQAPSDDTYNPKCTHSLMETQCNHSQYPILMKKNCTHNPSTSQVSKSYHPNPVTFPYPPDPGEILTDDTNTIIIRSAVRSATKTSPNLRLDPPKGEDQSQDLTSDVFVYGRPNPAGSDNTPPMSIINFDDLLGRTFLLPMDENGERKRATISEHVNDLCQEQVSREDQLRFKLKIDGDQLDDLISYNQLMEYLEDKTDTGPLEDGLYRFKCIKDHKGPYTSSDPEYNGSSYNLLIEWETGEQTWEPLSNIIASDPYTCAVYAKEHNLLNTPGWKLLKRHARTARRLIRTLKKSKYRQARASIKDKHGWEVPRDYAHALQLDIHNGNNKWKEAIDLEIEQIKEYQVFKEFGKAVYDKNNITNAPKGHQKIRVHFVFDVKHCGKFKARLVADGHLTKEPMETVYSGVVSIRNLRLAMFLAELNNLKLWGADVGNAYLQALTREKLYIVGGPEFEELQGHVLVMYKALYGTRSGGACWHDQFSDILHHMGFKPSRADPDIWMKSSKDGSHYEYIAVYVDDLAICMKDPKSFCDTLKEKYKLKLKGVGPINYHLGCGYTRDEDGTLVADPRKYIEKILESYEKPMEKNQRRPRHLWWEEITQRVTYLIFVTRTRSNNIRQLLDN